MPKNHKISRSSKNILFSHTQAKGDQKTIDILRDLNVSTLLEKTKKLKDQSSIDNNTSKPGEDERENGVEDFQITDKFPASMPLYISRKAKKFLKNKDLQKLKIKFIDNRNGMLFQILKNKSQIILGRVIQGKPPDLKKFKVAYGCFLHSYKSDKDNKDAKEDSLDLFILWPGNLPESIAKDTKKQGDALNELTALRQDKFHRKHRPEYGRMKDMNNGEGI